MSFTSAAYLIFLPLVFIVYWLMKRRVELQNALIVAVSYLFYGWWDARFLLLIAFTTLTSYGLGIAIAKNENSRKRQKILSAANIVINLAILCVFKYFNFFSESFAEMLSLFGLKAGSVTLNIILPAGISFYTFQAISYTIDVYRKQIRATKNVMVFAAYIAFFPQLVAGPIERATHMIPIFQSPRKFNYAQAVEGLRRILLGLFKKMVIADNCADAVSAIFSSYQSQGSLVLAFGALLFTIEIYGDFSGYSDIAIGSSKLFGIELSENFKAPYFASSISDFWRRWHMTLMSWFRDYVYIPLGGGRRSKTRNTFIVFLLSGLWHGANCTFVTWGAYHAALFLPFRAIDKTKIPLFVRRIITFFCVVIGWIIFRSATLSDAFSFMSRMFSFTNLKAMPPSATYSLVAIIAAALLFATEYATRKKENVTDLFDAMPKTARRASYIVLTAIIIAMGAAPTAFIYFQF